jgi:monoamine oxidase
MRATPLTGSQLYDALYFNASEWRTIDGGLNRLPLAFHPLVDHDTYMNRNIERIRYTESNGQADTKQDYDSGKPYHKVQLDWRDTSNSTDPSPHLNTSTFDYALISAPFTVVRSWRLLHSLPTTITNAIHNLGYGPACKVALEYSTRFWEHCVNPIIGGCSTTTDILGIGTICYPSYDINGTGKASILASYTALDRPVSLGGEEHVRMVLDAMTEIHGEETRALYTGKYDRRCWSLDPLERAGWASPSIGQHQLYIPEYFRTYDGVSLLPKFLFFLSLKGVIIALRQH